MLKQTSKSKSTSVKRANESLIKAGLYGVIAILLAVGFITPVATADRFDDQIRSLQADNNAKSSVATQLKVEADSLQGTINALQAQITALQDQIAANQAKSVDLEKQIAAAEAELEKQRKVLGENIKAMYLDGQPTTIEMLAASKDLSEFFDKQQYRDVVKTKIKSTLDKVTALKAQLNEQKESLDKLLAEQLMLNTQLSTQKAEQDRLLNMNVAQQNELNSQIKANYSKISNLRVQQAAENAKLFSNGLQNIPDTSGYPWASKPFPEGGFDPWGMEYRQCVSYTAWHVWKDGKYMPAWGWQALGNANQWDDDARRDGIPVDGNATPGSIAIKNAGFYGHAMYVEHNYGDGTILISQYNALWDGKYSMARISTAGLVFIHF